MAKIITTDTTCHAARCERQARYRIEYANGLRVDGRWCRTHAEDVKQQVDAYEQRNREYHEAAARGLLCDKR